MMIQSSFHIPFMTALLSDNSMVYCIANLYSNRSVIDHYSDTIQTDIAYESRILKEIDSRLDIYTKASNGGLDIDLSEKVFNANMIAPSFLMESEVNQHSFVVQPICTINPANGREGYRVYVYIYKDRYLVADPFFGSYYETKEVGDIYFFYQGKIKSIDIVGMDHKHVRYTKAL